ncbi:regulatory LuxR family protein [Labedaea rhizosphaerae]|uniref:Regulatory LuxR family protein n=2 Tax=Labedaea rhizosphaerae TaxID=598644 RepID=A0A4R6SGK1_LABRH|nr:regulatory LuxR family protein [Labedaea rhizosphaerae]
MLNTALADVGEGRGSAFVLVGGVGCGRTSVLDALDAPGFRVLRATGSAAERDLGLAGLHQLGLPVAATSDDFSFCATVFDNVRAAADARPLLVLVDDADQLDRPSLRALAFTARRVAALPVVVVFAVHDPPDALAGITRVPLPPLAPPAAASLLKDRVGRDPGEDLLADLVDLGSGVPLALVELAEALTPAQLAGQAAPPTAPPADGRFRAAVAARLGALGPDARRFVLLAALDGDGAGPATLDLATAVRVAEAAGLDLAALDEARRCGLVRVEDDEVDVPGRALRASLRAEASVADRRLAHQLVVQALDPEHDRFRWTWHRAALAAGPAPKLADELLAVADSARAAGDNLAAAAAYRRSAALAREPDDRAGRLLAAATQAWLGGRPRHARVLVREVLPLTTAPHARGLADLLLGGLALRDRTPALAVETLLAAAERLRSRKHAATALVLAGEASCLAGDSERYFAIAERAERFATADDPPYVHAAVDHFRGMAATFRGRHADAIPPLRRVLRTAAGLDEPTLKVWASQAAYTLGDAELARDLAVAAVRTAGNRGMAALLPWALVYVAMAELLLDRHSCALGSAEQGVRTATALGQPNSVADHLSILALEAALRGDRDTATGRLDAALHDVASRGLGRPGALASWASACVDLVDEHPEDAMNRLRTMASGAGGVHPGIRVMAAPQYIEAAVQCGRRGTAAKALHVFDDWAGATGSTARLALSARCHALLAANPADAEERYRAAIDLHRASGTALELAKTELFYAHHLRRERRPKLARDQLRDALRIFQRYDATHWARRALTELRATGEAAPQATRTTPVTVKDLTPQQAEIVRLVAEGATNREVAARLFISHRTVDHHLRNIFAKLGVRSRVELVAFLR